MVWWCKLRSMILRALPSLVVSITQGESIYTSHVKKTRGWVGVEGGDSSLWL